MYVNKDASNGTKKKSNRDQKRFRDYTICITENVNQPCASQHDRTVYTTATELNLLRTRNHLKVESNITLLNYGNCVMQRNGDEKKENSFN